MRRATRYWQALGLALVIASGGCAAVSRGVEVLVPEQRSPLRVGTSGDYPPFSLRTEHGVYRGFDVVVAEAFARARGRRLVLVPFDWPELDAKLADGAFDVAMSGVTVRADRLLHGEMTAAVARADAVVMTRGRARGIAAFDRPGMRLGVNRGGHLERLARARLPRATLVPVDDNQSLPDLLRAGTVDAIVTDSLEARAFQRRAGGAELRLAARLAHDRKAYWVAPDRGNLRRALDAWLLARERDGWLPALRAKLLGEEPSFALPPAAVGLADLLARRLSLMPLVAHAKAEAGVPIADRAREHAVEQRALARAEKAGLAMAPYRALVEAQFAAAKAVQRAAQATPGAATPPDGSPAPTIGELRHAIDRIDDAIIERIAGLPRRRLRVAALRYAIARDADLPGLDDGTHIEALAAAVAALAPAAQGGEVTVSLPPPVAMLDVPPTVEPCT